ncbi:DUF3253 domain-containing protein [Qipengyuania marisflavi]|uniref:DUF3253 domain-containing protein n=1 Tax=Qipengyuania marisflavi TaxID=2486356 RepID=A0A5S3PSZ3_9SPHN|nr:DUF3253 domain-containing protein [Qipengyuania marisflavi]TMM46713.1 DUF3253 domain-containing protein [Qipengyuania marisflavi]
MSAERAILNLLARRGPDATICPSEAARLLAGPAGDWRAQMTGVHGAADQLAADGRIRLTWKGASLAARDGAYRIGAVTK